MRQDISNKVQYQQNYLLYTTLFDKVKEHKLRMCSFMLLINFFVSVSSISSADVIRFYFNNVTAVDNDPPDEPIIAIGPQRAGFIDFNLAPYYNGINASVSLYSQNPSSWDALGLHDLFISFGGINISLYNLQDPAIPSRIVDWLLYIIIPDAINPDDLRFPDVVPTAFELRITLDTDEFRFSLTDSSSMTLSGVYGTDAPGVCRPSPPTQTLCTVNGDLSQPVYVAEPTTLAVFGVGIFALAVFHRRRLGIVRAE